MSILSDIWDTGKTFITDNKDWLKPVLSTGLGALKQSNIDNSQSQYLDYLKQREAANYQNSVDQINAYNAQLAAAGSGGGGGSGAGAAAARATEANRMKALKKGNKQSQNTYKQLLEIYAPYRETADVLLPQMTKTYQDALAQMSGMAGYLKQPNQMAKLDAAVPAWQVQVPLPDSVRLK